PAGLLLLRRENDADQGGGGGEGEEAEAAQAVFAPVLAAAGKDGTERHAGKPRPGEAADNQADDQDAKKAEQAQVVAEVNRPQQTDVGQHRRGEEKAAAQERAEQDRKREPARPRHERAPAVLALDDLADGRAAVAVRFLAERAKRQRLHLRP